MKLYNIRSVIVWSETGKREAIDKAKRDGLTWVSSARIKSPRHDEDYIPGAFRMRFAMFVKAKAKPRVAYAGKESAA